MATAPPFAQWAQGLDGLILKVAGEAIELAARQEDQTVPFFADLREAAASDAASGCDQNWEATSKAPVLLPESEFAGFINPVFWGNFCAVSIILPNIHRSAGGGWKGTGTEKFLVGCDDQGIEVQNLLDIGFALHPDASHAAKATYQLIRPLTGGFIVDQGYMATGLMQLGPLEASWLIGNKTFNLDPSSPLGKIVCALPYDAVQDLLQAWMFLTLLGYSFKVMDRVYGSQPSDDDQQLLASGLDDYLKTLESLGFDTAAGELKCLPG